MVNPMDVDLEVPSESYAKSDFNPKNWILHPTGFDAKEKIIIVRVSCSRSPLGTVLTTSGQVKRYLFTQNYGWLIRYSQGFAAMFGIETTDLGTMERPVTIDGGIEPEEWAAFKLFQDKKCVMA